MPTKSSLYTSLQFMNHFTNDWLLSRSSMTMCSYTNKSTMQSACIWLISLDLSASQQCFPLTPNQPAVLSAMAYKPIQPKRTSCRSSRKRMYSPCRKLLKGIFTRTNIATICASPMTFNYRTGNHNSVRKCGSTEEHSWDMPEMFCHVFF